MTENGRNGYRDRPTDGAAGDRELLIRLLETLGDEWKRAAVKHLAEQAEPCSIRDLAAAMARRHGVGVDRAHIRLYHRDIPALARQGFISVDWDERRIEPTETTLAVSKRLKRPEAIFDEEVHENGSK